MKAYNEGQKKKEVWRSNDLVKGYQSQTTFKKMDSNSYLVSYEKGLCFVIFA